MKTLPLVLLLLTVAPGLGSQIIAAPTAEQCVADANAWYQRNADARHYFASVPSAELVRRQAEMLQCADTAQADMSKYARYLDVAYAYEAAREVRYYQFIERHHLLGEFYAEDKKDTIDRK